MKILKNCQEIDEKTARTPRFRIYERKHNVGELTVGELTAITSIKKQPIDVANDTIGNLNLYISCLKKENEKLKMEASLRKLSVKS